MFLDPVVTLSLYSCMKKLRILLSVLILLLAVPPVAAQDGISRKEQEKKLAIKEKQEKKEIKKKEKLDRRRHLKIQDKPTRKRLKKHTRRADKHGSGRHRDGLFQRWFGRRR
jgi:hypothetical protein